MSSLPCEFRDLLRPQQRAARHRAKGMTCRRHPSSPSDSGQRGYPRLDCRLLAHRDSRARHERHRHRRQRARRCGAHLRQRGIRRGRILADRAGPQHRRRQRPQGWPARPLHPARPEPAVVSAVGCTAGHFDHHAGDRLPDRTDGGRPAAPMAGRSRRAGPVGRRDHRVHGDGDRDVGVDGVRRAGPEVPGSGAAAVDRARRCRFSAVVLAAAHPRHPADQRSGELDRAEAGHRARRRAPVGPLTAGTGIAGA